jgi:hypothetical protein
VVLLRKEMCNMMMMVRQSEFNKLFALSGLVSSPLCILYHVFNLAAPSRVTFENKSMLLLLQLLV